MGLEIRFLADRPEATATVAQWAHSEWGHKFHVSLKQMESGFRGRLHRDRIPFTLVGELDGKLVATSTVVSCDLPARKDLRPWLAAVYVDPAHRGKGYGAALVRAACAHAASLGNKHLYLYTESAPGFYEALGWTTLETRAYQGDEVTVMECKLQAPSTPSPKPAR
jgi:GNAT superfamily N-acetyltransferase